VYMATRADARSTEVQRSLETITSRENRWLKRFRAALDGEPPRKARREAGEMETVGVEGARLVETALRSKVGVKAVLFSETGARHLPKLSAWIPAETRLLRTTDRLFAQVAGTEAPQGVAALVQPRAATFDDLMTGLPLIVVLAAVQDPGNVGAMARAAEAFGASGLAACPADGIGTANPFGPKALRASAGSSLRLPVLRGIAAPVLMAQLRVAGVRVYAACPDESVAQDVKGAPGRRPRVPWEVDWRAPSALLIGNEGAGLPAELVRSADAIVSIPQSAAPQADDPLDSLNAAVAGGILLYEAARQRGLG
jgi:TrmH family RNA methyltransferase